MSLTAGAKLGPYEILAPLGAGGMGEVYRARDNRLGREVAVKVLPESTSKDPEALARFEREAQAVAAQSHPNILALYDIGHEHGVAFAVTELLEGETLRDRLSAGTLPARKALEYARQIAEGLGAAHDRGIVHRDLKPENIFVTTDGRVKILDFGLAKQVAADSAVSQENTPTRSIGTEPGVVMGTVGYMSPEQVRGERADHRSDIFSFGAVLYEMVSGQRAFKGDSAVETLNAILKEEPAELSSSAPVAPALERIIRHCLEKRPVERFQSARDLAFDLASLSGTTGGSAPIAAAAGRVKRWHLALATLAAVALIAGAFWLGGRLSARGDVEAEITDQQLTFQRGNILSARFTPDGESVIYSAGWNGQAPELYTARLDGSSSRPLGLKSANILSVSTKGELAVKLHRRLGTNPYMEGTLARVPIGGGTPREVQENVLAADWDPAGSELAVVLQSGAGKWRIEYPQGKLLYESSTALFHLRFSPGGDQLAFEQREPARSVIRRLVLDSGRTTSVVEVASTPSYFTGLAWAPSGRELWFGEAGRPFVIRAVDLRGTRRTLLTNLSDTYLHDLSRAGRVLVENGNLRIDMVAAAAGEPERMRSWLNRTVPVSILDGGATLLFTDAGDERNVGRRAFLYRNGAELPLDLGQGKALDISPDGRQVLVWNGETGKGLILVPVGAGRPRTFATGLSDVGSARFLPDGKGVVLLGAAPGSGRRFFLFDLDGGKPRPVTPGGDWAWGMAISPDGTEVALTTDKGDRHEIYPLRGGTPRPLTGAERGEYFRAWSSDGKSLFLLNTNEIAARFIRLDIATGRRERVHTLLPADPAGVISIWNAVVTPDGRAYAYAYNHATHSDLHVIEGMK